MTRCDRARGKGCSVKRWLHFLSPATESISRASDLISRAASDKNLPFGRDRRASR